MLLPPPDAGLQPGSPTPTLRERMRGVSPLWAWTAAAGAQLAVLMPFWLHKTPAPFYSVHRDVYRGWPSRYGLDQGDVGGDEWGPFTTYFQPAPFAFDMALAIACGLPIMILILLAGRRIRYRKMGS